MRYLYNRKFTYRYASRSSVTFYWGTFYAFTCAKVVFYFLITKNKKQFQVLTYQYVQGFSGECFVSGN